MATSIDWAGRARRYALDGYPDAAAPCAMIAVVEELRTLNLLLASQILHDSTAGETAAHRLGFDQAADSAEDGQG